MPVRILELGLLAVFSLASPVFAQSHADVGRLTSSTDPLDRQKGISLAVRLDDKASIQILERSVRRERREMGVRAKHLDAIDEQLGNLLVAIFEMEDTGEYQTAYGKYTGLVAKEKIVSARFEAEKAKLDDSLAFCSRVRDALRRFRSDDAVSEIEDQAVHEVNPAIREMYIAALEGPSRKRSIPVLLSLLKNKDARVRAEAVRSLRPFANDADVLAGVKPLCEDPVWAVRLGAYEVVARTPLPVAAPILTTAAGRESGAIAQRINAWLKEKTGQSFRQEPAAWVEWYKKHSGEIQNGTYAPPVKRGLAPGERRTFATFFDIPIDSTRVVLAIDYSGSMLEPLDPKDKITQDLLDHYGLPSTRLGCAQAETIRVIRGLPDGAYFNIIGYSDVANALSDRMLQVSNATRARAVQWVLKPRTNFLTNIYAALSYAFGDYLELSATAEHNFADLPDTLVLLTDGTPTRGRFRDTDPFLELVKEWNRAVDMTIDCVGIGGDQDRELLRSLAKATGGRYVDFSKGIQLTGH